MRDQYAGDVSDFLKFAFLRALAGEDHALGIAWYYASTDDGRADGQHLEWKEEKVWSHLDEELHTGLATLPERSVAALEQAAIWPKRGVLFHREPMPPRLQRSAWRMRMLAILDRADIVFLDPDNGIGEETEKHATLAEIKSLRRPGRAIVFITFPGHSFKHEALLSQLHGRLAAEVGATTLLTLRTSVSVPRAAGSRFYVQRQRWFTIVDPDHALTARANTFAAALRGVPRVSAQLECVAEETRVTFNPATPLSDLAVGTAYAFSEWPNPEVPTFAAGVYTIWHRDGRFIYVGMSGRGMTADTVDRKRPQGIYTRLKSHATGRRSGDQFCVYVADRFVLPSLSQEDITAIASGRHQMDAFVRRYIHENLSYRFVIVPDGRAALALEAAIKSGEWEPGKPLLNPVK